MKKFFLFVALILLQGKMMAQADKKFNELMQKGIKQVHDERKHDEAIKTFNEAAKLKSSSAELYGYRGFTYLEKAELDEYKSDDDHIDYGKNKNWQLALADFNTCIRLDSTIASAFYYRGMAYAMNREIKNALPDLNKAKQLDPGDKNVDQAIKDCKQNYVSYSLDMAREEIDKGLEIKTKDGSDSSYRNNMRLAVKFCDDAIPYDTQNNGLYLYKAKALYWLSKYDQADANIKRSLALSPDNADAKALLRSITEMMDYIKNLDKPVTPVSTTTRNEATVSATAPAPATGSKNSSDEVIRNLGTVLEQVVASAADPAKHLKELKGRKMRSKFYRADTHKSSIELPGALETFLSDFLKNDMHNYYYWHALIDEEPKANLNGSIKTRYKAVCEELKLLYPGIQSTFSYNDEHYFVMKLSNNVTIKVTYFYSEGYKDLVTLDVIAEHGK